MPRRKMEDVLQLREHDQPDIHAGLPGALGEPAARRASPGILLIRREELDGFIDGLFGKEESLEPPERARRAL